MTKVGKLDGEFMFAIVVGELLHVLDVYGETYGKDCVEAEMEVFRLTQDIVDFRRSIRLYVAMALSHLAGDLRDCLCQDFPKNTTSDRLARSISKINMLL